MTEKVEKKPRWQRRKEAKKLPKGRCTAYIPPKAAREMPKEEP